MGINSNYAERAAVTPNQNKSKIDEEFMVLRQGIDGLSEDLFRLMEKMQPVLTPSLEVPKVGVALEKCCDLQVSAQIRFQTERIMSLRACIAEAFNRLEL
jgi:hypothetical protein